MSVSETYLVMFAAIEAADFLLVIWLAVTLLLNFILIFHPERVTRTMNSYLLALYSLFALFVIGRWGVLVSKVMDMLAALRDAGESLPPQSLTMTFGLAGVVFLLGFTCLTLQHLRSRRGRTRVI
ncbi:MAG: hypothetical protein O2861_01145 [Proteobacteria bacterium]|nr:hypothetical protein [Pseudomonadota bacterium]